jgi:MoaA/NifB/PqqE/SkfB family radical SAM enzyme
MLVEITPAPSSLELAKQRIATLPIVVLELHSRCQCRCVMCDIWKRDSHQEFPLELLLKNRAALRELRVEWVVLSGGEPLMHSQFDGICKVLREDGIRITLLTAGIGLQKRARSVANCVVDVIVSLDGPRAVHDDIRGVKGAFDHLASGVLELLSLRPELRITARTTVQKLNHAALCETVIAAQELDLSGISFLAADLTSEAFNRELPWEHTHVERVALDVAETEALDSEIAAIASRFAREISSGYIAESPAKLRRIANHFRAGLGHSAHQAPMCNAPWVSAVIGYDGAVRPCFFHAPIGNLHRSSLSDVVNGQCALSFRSSLDIENNETCRRCVCSLHRKPREFNAEECLQTSDKSDIGV